MRLTSRLIGTTVLALAIAAPASAASIRITTLNASNTALDQVTVTDNGAAVTNLGVSTLSGDTNGLTGFMNVSGGIGGWSIGSIGISTSPVAGIDISFSGTCVSCDAFVEIEFSDTGFTTAVPTNGFTFHFSDSDSNTATIVGTAWDDTTNALFGHGTPIGTITLNAGGTGSTVFGGGPTTSTPPGYSLTIQTLFAATSGIYSADANLTGSAVPEPASLLLLGTGLIGLANLGRNRFLARRRQ